jgi:hypothetical protein
MPNIVPSFVRVWAGFFLPSWTALFVTWPTLRPPMHWASVLTAPLGLIEPIFTNNRFENT